MVYSSLTSSKYWDIGKNNLKWAHLRPNSGLSQKQNEFIYGYTMVHQTGNRPIQAVMNNLKFIILYYLVAKKSGILDWRRYSCDWSISNHSFWKVMPSRRVTEYSTHGHNGLHTHTRHRSIDWNHGVAECVVRYVQHMLYACVT